MADEATGTAGLAGRYATALFELAREREAFDEVAGDLATVRGMLEESADFRRMVQSPAIGRGEQGRAVAALAEYAGLGTLAGNFLGLLARNRRLFALGQMIRAFDALLAEHRGEVTADVASAGPLTEAQRDALTDALKRALGRVVRLSEATDASLIGGLVVRVGSRMVDASLKARLQSLRLAMKGAR